MAARIARPGGCRANLGASDASSCAPGLVSAMGLTGGCPGKAIIGWEHGASSFRGVLFMDPTRFSRRAVLSSIAHGAAIALLAPAGRALAAAAIPVGSLE